MKRVVAVALIWTAALGTLGALAPPAWAHAALVSSDPADGAQLKSAPASVTMTFTETPDPKLSVVHVFDTAGASVESGSVASVAGGSKELRIAMKLGLPDGVYTVSWRVVSQVDGHVTTGAFAFGVGVAPGTVSSRLPPAATPEPSVLSVVGKVLLYVGLSILVGAAVIGLWAFGGEIASRRALLITAGVLSLVGAVSMLFAERATVGVSLSTLVSSSAGHAYVWLLGVTALAAAAAVIAALRDSRATLAAAGMSAATAMLVRAIGGHAAAAGSAWVQVGVQWLHFLAVGAWVGGFVPVLLIVRARRAAAKPAPIDAIRCYSTIAAAGLAVVIVSGAVRAISLMGVHEIVHTFSTSYGTTLAIKVLVAAVLIALGAVNRFRSIPRLAHSSSPFVRVISLEVVAAIGVFALTGVLTGLAPRPQASSNPARISEIVANGSDVATTVKVKLVVAPGAPGRNTYQLTPTGFDSGLPVQAVGVTLQFQPVGRPGVGTSSLDLRPGSAGTWVGEGTQLSIQGTWDVTVTLQTDTGGVQIPLSLTTSPPPEVVTVARQAGEPDIYSIALPGGDQIQAYNDPGATGPNQLHLTAFDAAGKELPLASVTMTAIAPQGIPQPLSSTRFSAGHFVASVTLTAGGWRFDLSATTKDGRSLLASFDQTIGPTSG
ncbi:MAG: copper resistance protein CopC [Actinomycetota bacterium]|nr:copper resistance protein CopC [Actinomycetota bacterium]